VSKSFKTGKSDKNKIKDETAGRYRMNGSLYIARNDDTLKVISAASGVDIDVIVELNRDFYPGLSPSARLRTGTIIRLNDSVELVKGTSGRHASTKHCGVCGSQQSTEKKLPNVLQRLRLSDCRAPGMLWC